LAASTNEPAIYVISGTQGAGKTTVAGLLAHRFERGAHVEADTLQKMIVAGREWPEANVVTRDNHEVTGEAGVQLRLRLRNACILARSFYEHGITAVVDDIIFGDRLAELAEHLGDLPYRFVMLVPDVAAVRSRERERGTNLWPEWEWLTERIVASQPRPGLWLDSSNMTAERTVDEILREADKTLVVHARAGGAQ
jgi:chloramphenicol 3-O-phosphotransferase